MDDELRDLIPKSLFLQTGMVLFVFALLSAVLAYLYPNLVPYLSMFISGMITMHVAVALLHDGEDDG